MNEQPQPSSQPTPSQAPAQVPAPQVPQMAVPVAAQNNPGKTLGIVSIVLGVLTLWLIGLPLAIVSMVKSGKAGASKVLGIVGLVLNILAIGSSIILLSIGIAALASVQEKARTQSTNDTTKSVLEESSTTTIALSDDYVVSGGNAYWAVSTPGSGWTTDYMDQAGKNSFTKDDRTAAFMTYQGLDPSLTGKTDLEASRVGTRSLLKGAKNLVIGTENRMAFAAMSGGPDVEFLVSDYSYTASSGSAVRGRMVGRAFDNGHYLYAWYTAAESAFSETEWSKLVDGLSVNDGVY